MNKKVKPSINNQYDSARPTVIDWCTPTMKRLKATANKRMSSNFIDVKLGL